jgi:hypothetical protein
MKGSSRMVGAVQLARLYEIIEKAAHNADLADARAEIVPLHEAVKTFEACLVETKVSTAAM